MVAKFGSDWRVRVARGVDCAGLQLKGSILEWSHHGTPCHPAQVTLGGGGSGEGEGRKLVKQASEREEKELYI